LLPRCVFHNPASLQYPGRPGPARQPKQFHQNDTTGE
jgi:hypothetical protein